ncbi:hypothetical protein LQV05_006745 [Cryptococcus neoformans]|nr:hypothetical protein LQV05_006745 [Cryptococcus neoformans]
MSILKLRSALAPLSVRRFATAAPSVSVTSTRSNASAPILGNIEASWKTLPAEEQYEVYQQLEQLQKKNWKELTIDEKKAGQEGTGKNYRAQADVTVRHNVIGRDIASAVKHHPATHRRCMKPAGE